MADSHVIENWRPVVGFEGLYEVSDLGRVKSFHKSREAILSPGRQSVGGHLTVALVKNGRAYSRLIHRLVLEAFVGPRPPKGVCRHYPDRSPTNNALTNLRWGTQKENGEDTVEHGMSVRGSRNGRSKLVEHEVKSIREMKAAGASNREIGIVFGVSGATVSRACNGVGWKNVPLKTSVK